MTREMLVIEADEVVAQLFAAIFTQPGWNIDTPHHGRNAAEFLLGSKHYDIILDSFQFPATNGVEGIRLIRELERRKDAPVSMVTRRHDAEGEALEAGANEGLFKPFVPTIVVAAVARNLSPSDCPVARGSVGATTGGGAR
jgi:DNA-binding response OmpR family regulator